MTGIEPIPACFVHNGQGQPEALFEIPERCIGIVGPVRFVAAHFADTTIILLLDELPFDHHLQLALAVKPAPFTWPAEISLIGDNAFVIADGYVIERNADRAVCLWSPRTDLHSVIVPLAQVANLVAPTSG